MRIQRSGEHKVMPWKNGLGVTREVALEPADLPGEPFLWRLSLATIRVSGPFSLFPGIDRTIAALSGDPVRLLVDGKHAATLDALGAPWSFTGEAVVDAVSDGGETTDLNIMTQRGQATHRMARLDIGASLSLVGENDRTMIVFTVPAKISSESDACAVEAFDVALDIGRGQGVTIETTSPAIAYLIGVDINR